MEAEVEVGRRRRTTTRQREPVRPPKGRFNTTRRERDSLLKEGPAEEI